jgi:hypothetical protein
MNENECIGWNWKLKHWMTEKWENMNLLTSEIHNKFAKYKIICILINRDLTRKSSQEY